MYQSLNKNGLPLFLVNFSSVPPSKSDWKVTFYEAFPDIVSPCYILTCLFLIQFHYITIIWAEFYIILFIT